MTADVFVAIPVYGGAEVLGETLRSVRDQTYTRFRALVSFDGPNEDALAVARPFLADPRFELVVHPDRFGWLQHFNWLVRRCDMSFFCYWPQDDLAATNYLTELRSCFDRDSAAAVACSDVQWFGRLFHRDVAPSYVGTPAERVLGFIEGIRYEPLRGLIRADFLPHPALDSTIDDGCHAEFPFLAALAAQGNILRTDRTLYFKRAHAANTFAQWNAWPPARRRRAWIDMGVVFWRLARSVIESSCHRRLLATILDRLGVPRPGRSYFVQPQDTSVSTLARLTRDFADRAGIRIPLGNPSHPLEAFCQPIEPGVFAALDVVEAELARRHADTERGVTEIDFTSDGRHTLGYGWSVPEPWGVWSDGPQAVLHLPLPSVGMFGVRLIGRHYPQAGRATATIGWRHGEVQGTVEVETGEATTFSLDLTGCHPLELTFLDAVNLAEVGVADPRCVAWGLSRVEVEPTTRQS